ncbi:hypothetical protein HO173_001163 [Letharia columbiana]|uniref:Rhodopsin domain-containing protein n=1 Tax=Letharia columbiana TaxID=112416 RepID=A0A8H6G4Y9_9LECA|nr:uncharacterized protein HO173_001163 [Letharia columbiana]KAF6240495.1 hypothetical protein HO173_001163 [Letharia columbiana]
MVINTDPSSQQHAIVVVCIVSPIVSSLFVAIRVWTRAFVSSSIGWDDYTALVTWLFCIAYSVLIGLGTNYGFGWHTADIRPDRYVVYNEWIFISSIVYLITLLGYKFSILLLYLRIFGVDKNFRYSTWVVMFFVFGYLFSNTLTQVFGCTPIDKNWKPKTPGHCILMTKADFAYGSMNLISDLFIFVLPLPMVWRLQLSWKGKLGVTLILMGGAIAFVVALVRYSLLLHRFYVTDITWYDGKNLLWMVLEVNTGLVCSCTPALRPYFTHIASNGFFKAAFGGLISHPKDSVRHKRRSDSGQLVRRNTGGDGFVVLGNNETEMEVPHNKALKMVQDV